MSGTLEYIHWEAAWKERKRRHRQTEEIAAGKRWCFKGERTQGRDWEKKSDSDINNCLENYG